METTCITFSLRLMSLNVHFPIRNKIDFPLFPRPLSESVKIFLYFSLSILNFLPLFFLIYIKILDSVLAQLCRVKGLLICV